MYLNLTIKNGEKRRLILVDKTSWVEVWNEVQKRYFKIQIQDLITNHDYLCLGKQGELWRVLNIQSVS